jgi:hypothetical protein
MAAPFSAANTTQGRVTLRIRGSALAGPLQAAARRVRRITPWFSLVYNSVESATYPRRIAPPSWRRIAPRHGRRITPRGDAESPPPVYL